MGIYITPRRKTIRAKKGADLKLAADKARRKKPKKSPIYDAVQQDLVKKRTKMKGW